MAITSAFQLPAQPAAGVGTIFTPLGGDGKSAPLGQYDVSANLVGDASSGAATIQCSMDPRYMSMIGHVQASVEADTAAGEFQILIADFLPNMQLAMLGTLPGVAEAMFTLNSSYLWFPPPIWMTGASRVQTRYANVDATETYKLDCCIYVFDRNVRQLEAVQWLNMVRVGVNAVPAA